MQLSIVSSLLLLIIIYALYNNSFEMAFAATLMLIISLIPFYFKAAHNVFIPSRSIFSIMGTELELGPSVATILVLVLKE